MPINYIFDELTQTVHTIAQGRLHAEDLILHLEAVATAGLFACPQIIDARKASMKLTAKDVRQIVNLSKKLRATYGVASMAFVTTSELVYGMMRMYMSLSESYDPGFAVFRDIASAKAWVKN